MKSDKDAILENINALDSRNSKVVIDAAERLCALFNGEREIVEAIENAVLVCPVLITDRLKEIHQRLTSQSVWSTTLEKESDARITEELSKGQREFNEEQIAKAEYLRRFRGYEFPEELLPSGIDTIDKRFPFIIKALFLSLGFDLEVKRTPNSKISLFTGREHFGIGFPWDGHFACWEIQDGGRLQLLSKDNSSTAWKDGAVIRAFCFDEQLSNGQIAVHAGPRTGERRDIKVDWIKQPDEHEIPRLIYSSMTQIS